MPAFKKQSPLSKPKNTVILFLAFTGLCFGQSTWEWSNPLPQGNPLSCAAYGDSLFVAISDGGTIMTSPNGATWTIRNSGTINDLYSAAYGGGQTGRFVAVGYNGTIVTSPDGKTWTTKNFGISNDLYSITYGSGQFVAVGENGMLLTSADGASWTIGTSGTSTVSFP